MKAEKTVPVKKEERMAAPAWSGFGSMRLFDEAEDLFERLFDIAPYFRGRRWGMDFGPTPKMDVVESDGAYELTAELPGMDEKDIEVVMRDRVLMLKGEKKEEREEKKEDYRLCERRYGTFERAFTLPEGVDATKVKARFVKGVLHITLPKTKESQLKQRKIPVEGF